LLHRRKDSLTAIGQRDNGLKPRAEPSHWLSRNQAQRQPDDAENDSRQHIGQKMRAQSNSSESHHRDQQRRAKNA
jgi:hypothetical protein